MAVRASLLFFFLGLIGPEAVADCRYITKDNQRLLQNLNQHQAALANYESLRASLENSCNQKEAGISKSAAVSATAESCVALREVTEMNEQLSGVSEICSSKILSVEKETEFFETTKAIPFAHDLDELVELHNISKPALPRCLLDFKNGEAVKTQAHSLVQRSQKAVSKAKAEVSRFKLLAEKTKAMAESTQAAASRCQTQDSSLVVVAKVLPIQKAVGAAKLSRARHENPASTITGDPSKAELHAGVATASVKRPESGAGGGTQEQGNVAAFREPAAIQGAALGVKADTGSAEPGQGQEAVVASGPAEPAVGQAAAQAESAKEPTPEEAKELAGVAPAQENVGWMKAMLRNSKREFLANDRLKAAAVIAANPQGQNAPSEVAPSSEGGGGSVSGATSTAGSDTTLFERVSRRLKRFAASQAPAP